MAGRAGEAGQDSRPARRREREQKWKKTERALAAGRRGGGGEGGDTGGGGTAGGGGDRNIISSLILEVYEKCFQKISFKCNFKKNKLTLMKSNLVFRNQSPRFTLTKSEGASSLIQINTSRCQMMHNNKCHMLKFSFYQLSL